MYEYFELMVLNTRFHERIGWKSKGHCVRLNVGWTLFSLECLGFHQCKAGMHIFWEVNDSFLAPCLTTMFNSNNYGFSNHRCWLLFMHRHNLEFGNLIPGKFAIRGKSLQFWGHLLFSWIFRFFHINISENLSKIFTFLPNILTIFQGFFFQPRHCYSNKAASYSSLPNLCFKKTLPFGNYICPLIW